MRQTQRRRTSARAQRAARASGRSRPAATRAGEAVAGALLATIREALAAPASSPARQLLQVPN